VSYLSGTRVRLKKDPGRIGVTTGKTRPLGKRLILQVQFPDRAEWQPEYELESVDNDNADVFELLRKRRFGRADDLRRSLTFVHLSGRVANLVYSMGVTNSDFYAFQYKPVLNVLDSPSNGLLIADEVGLGKTIEAGLIWTELRARYDARRLVVICPAMLREKWQDELANRFGVEAIILDARGLTRELKRARHQVPDGKAFICSLQGARPPRGWNPGVEPAGPTAELAALLQENAELEPLIDLVVIDEAHYMRNPGTQTAKLGRLLRDVTEHLVLLTATPINLSSDDLFHLLNLVDPDSFNDRRIFPEVLAANAPLIEATRLARDNDSSAESIRAKLEEALQHDLLRTNIQLRDIYDDDDLFSSFGNSGTRVNLANRIDRVNLMRHAISRTRKRDVTEWQVIRDSRTQFIPLPEGSPEYRLYEAVTSAVREYAEKKDTNDGFLLASPQRQVSSCMYAAAKSWANKVYDHGIAYEDVGTDANEDALDQAVDEQAPLISHLARTILPSVDLEELRRVDSKYRGLLEVLHEYLTEFPDEKIILFSYFRGTLNYLQERLEKDDISCELLMGGLKESKQEIINRFRTSPNKRILLCSEVASEGVDLQFSRLLINYDLPWNPMKIEQRIGRIDRLGQKEKKIHIWNILFEGTIDSRIYQRLMMRIGVFEHALGGLEAILGSEIRRLTADLLSKMLTPEQEEKRIQKTALALEQNRQNEDDLEKEAVKLLAHSDFILEKVKMANEFNKRITATDLVSYVRDYLQGYYKGYRFYQIDPPVELIYEIALPTELAARLRDFVRDNQIPGVTTLDQAHAVRCQFSNKVGRFKEKYEQIGQFHPLIRLISKDLTEKNEGFYPLIAAELGKATGSTANLYAFALSRWHFNGLRNVEELQAQALDLRTGALIDLDQSWELVNRARLNGTDWIAMDDEVQKQDIEGAFYSCMGSLTDQFEKHRHERECENKDRSDFQIRAAERNRDRHLASLEELAERYRANGSRMLPAQLGKIEKLQKNFAVRVDGLRRKTTLTSRQEEICYGVIKEYAA